MEIASSVCFRPLAFAMTAPRNDAPRNDAPRNDAPRNDAPRNDALGHCERSEAIPLPQRKILKNQGEVGVVVGVVVEQLAPFLPHETGLGVGHGSLGTGVVGATGDGFVVVQLGIGREQVAVTRLTHLEAKVHVVERHLQVRLVQTAHLLEHRLSHQQTSGGNGRHVVRQVQPTKVAVGISAEVLLRMPRHAAYAQHHTCVLNGVIGVIELGTHAANLR